MTNDVELSLKYHLFRQVVSDFIISFPISAITFMASDTRLAVLYTATHFFAITTYVLMGIWGLDSIGNTAGNSWNMILKSTPTFAAHCVAWVDFIFAYTLGYRTAYCGDSTIRSPNFYKTFAMTTEDYCDAFKTGGAIYTLVLAFVLVYCSIPSVVFGLSHLSVDGSNGDFAKAARFGTLVYAVVVIRFYQSSWFFSEWGDLSYAFPLPTRDSMYMFGLFVTGCTTFVLGLAYMIIIQATGSPNFSKVIAQSTVGALITASEVATVVFSIFIFFKNNLQTTMESLLPILIFLPSGMYIMIVWYSDSNNSFPLQRPFRARKPRPVDFEDEQESSFSKNNTNLSRRLVRI